MLEMNGKDISDVSTRSEATFMCLQSSQTNHDNYPGPGAYAPEHYPLMKETRQPSYTMGGCTPQHELQQTPGPNEYMIPSTIGSNMSDKQVAASYTMAGKLDDHTGFRSPGPAKYSPTELNLYMNRSPNCTIAGLCGGIVDRSQNPGPAAYMPEFIPTNSAPHFSFGVKHGANSPPFVLEEDNIQ